MGGAPAADRRSRPARGPDVPRCHPDRRLHHATGRDRSDPHPPPHPPPRPRPTLARGAPHRAERPRPRGPTRSPASGAAPDARPAPCVREYTTISHVPIENPMPPARSRLSAAGDRDAGLTGTATLIARPAAIVLTHGHFDHVGAMRALAERWDAPIVAHPQELPLTSGVTAARRIPTTVDGIRAARRLAVS